MSKSSEEIRHQVRVVYGQVTQDSCCGTGPIKVNSSRLGYSQSDLLTLPKGADLGLGCGNPLVIAALKPGETVLDLGSGAGVDCFLAARAVGATGQVIGVDMTPEMLTKARANAHHGGFQNVEFRLGEIEHLPVADHSVDVIISNCVINLSPAKLQVFHEAFRVLKPGGRLAVSDVVAQVELPVSFRQDERLYSSCLGGAETVDTLRRLLVTAGFVEIRIEFKESSRDFIKEWAPEHQIEDYVVSATIEAVKSSTKGAAPLDVTF